jgi:FAD/FMN-containing dehydrogenase
MSISQVQIEELRSLRPDILLITPDSPDYQKAIHRWLALSIRPAGLVSYLMTPQHISVLASFASTHSLDVAVTSGGHGVRSVSSSAGGLVIDLSRFKTLSVSGNEARIGAGCLWSEIYSFLGERELGIVGGVCTGVGIGGYSLLGGYGWLTGAHGPAVDNIISVIIVLASGEIVRAAEHENVDLFWTIRGAEPAFGIVCEFVMKVHPQANLVWNGAMVFARKDLKTVLGVADSVMGPGNEKGKVAMDFTWGVRPDPEDEIKITKSWYFRMGVRKMRGRF